MTKRKFQAVKGTRDILPPKSALWNRVEQTARRVLEAYNFHEIRLPVFEEYEVFARSVGVDTDIVSKEMYTLEDRDGTVLALRPEATASVVRAYIEHGMHTRPGNVKLYYCGPMFRRERPQKGRYRQFYQLGAEVLGPSDHPAIDAEIIEMALVFLEQCGLKGCTLDLNSIGCAECRPQYVALLRKELMKVKDRLGPDSQRRIDTNPLRVLDSKVEGEQPIIAKLPSIADHLCAACRANFEAVQQELKDRGIAYKINPRLVRGLDYYVRTTFEITAPGLGAQNAVCGGGRYDGLVELLGGPPTKATGWALGIDRLILALPEREAAPEELTQVDLAVVGTVGETWDEAHRLASSLRRRGLRVYVAQPETKLSKALQTASRLGITVAIIVGKDEFTEHRYAIRVMKPFAEGQPRDTSVETDLVGLYGKILKLRVDLELGLKRWASAEGKVFWGGTTTIAHVLKYFGEKQLLDQRTMNELQDLISNMNRVIHGQHVTEHTLESLLARGYLLLDRIENLPTPK